MSDDLIRFAAARRSSRAELHAAWLDGGTLKVYTSPVPASADVAISTQTLLTTFTLPDPFGDENDGVLTADAIAPALIAASGTAAWARALDDADAVIGDYDVGGLSSGAAIEMETLTLVSGAYASIASFTITEG